jgi:hypothetical protein
MQPRAGERVPLHDNQFARKAVSVRLLDEPVGEDAKSPEHLAAVIVVAARHDEADAAVRFPSSGIHAAQPNSNSLGKTLRRHPEDLAGAECPAPTLGG